MSATLESIRKLMAEGETGEAIKELLNYCKNTKHENTIILQASRYNSVQKERDQGVIAGEAAKIEIARISNAILNLIEKLEKEAPKETKSPTNSNDFLEVGQEGFPSDSKAYKIKNIYSLISASFDNAGLVKFCMFNFEEVYNNFSEGQAKDAKIVALIDHAKRKLILGKLLSLLQEENPAQYEKHQPYF